VIFGPGERVEELGGPKARVTGLLTFFHAAEEPLEGLVEALQCSATDGDAVRSELRAQGAQPGEGLELIEASRRRNRADAASLPAVGHLPPFEGRIEKLALQDEQS